MTAAFVWAILILAGSIVFLAGELEGRRRERRLGRERQRRLLAERTYEDVTMLDLHAELADNDCWSRKVTHLEVVR